MADNISLPATGVVAATDEVGGVHFQRVKLDLGTDGASSPVSGTVPISGTVEASPLAADTVATEALVSVATSTTSVLAANSSRKGGWARNISDVDIYVSFSGAAATNKPSLVRPEASISLAGPGWVYTGAVSAIHADSGSKILEVVEF